MGVFLNGQAINGKDQRGQAVVDDSFLVLFNGHHEETDWTLPKQWGESWTVLLDTTAPDRQGQTAEAGQRLPVAGEVGDSPDSPQGRRQLASPPLSPPLGSSV